MLFKFFKEYKGKIKVYDKVPDHLKKYAVPYARVIYVRFDEGEYLSQEIRGRNFSIWLHHFFIKDNITLGAFTECLCRTLNYTRKGTLFCDMIPNGRIKLQENTYSLFCVPPKIMHPCYFTPGNYCFMHLDMNDELLERIDFNPICKKALQAYLQNPNQNGSQLPPCSMHQIVKDIIDKIATCRLEGKGAFLSFVSHEVSCLLFEFNKQIPEIQKYKRKNRVAERTANIALYVQGNLDKNLTIASVSKEHKISGSTLCRDFVKYLGMPPGEFFLESRMLSAREQLQESDKPISDISSDLGYAQISNFCRAYKDRFGITPGEERNARAARAVSVGL